ncbi:MAG: hypothetical protein J6K72_06035 [Clostridia bacterium]|nr:hypothetical protein [Clostridia bacterium]
MDTMNTMKKFLKPNLVVTIILLIPPLTFLGLIGLLFGTLPANKRMKKHLASLEQRGLLAQAAAEMSGPNVKQLMKGNLLLTDHFIYCKGMGIVLPYEDAVWAYKHRQSNSLLFIPIIVQDSLYLATTTEKVRQVAVMGKDKHDEIKEAILTIYSKNQNCLIGYNNDTIAAYRQWKKQMKAASD